MFSRLFSLKNVTVPPTSIFVCINQSDSAPEHSTLTNLINAETVAIFVGPRNNRKAFYVDRSLLARYPYFESALSSGNQSFKWHREHAVDVEAMIQWMMDGTLGKLSIVPTDKGNWSFVPILSAYSLAKRYKLLGFQNALTDHGRDMLGKQNLYSSSGSLRVAYEKGLRGQPIVQMLIHSIIFQMFTYPANFQEGSKKLVGIQRLAEAPEVMADFLQETAVFNLNKLGDPVRLEGCHFHDHSDGSSCVRVGKDVITDPEPKSHAPPSYEADVRGDISATDVIKV